MSVINIVAGLPIKPAFGTTRGVMEGMLKNAAPVGGVEWIDAQPPSHHMPLHRPSRISAIWEKILELLRNPVETYQLADGCKVIHVLATAIFRKNSDETLTPYLWEISNLESPRIEQTDDISIILQGMPWRWLWLSRLLHFAKLEYRSELEFLKIDDAYLDQYFDWLRKIICNRIRRFTDMRQVRTKIRHALELDANAMRRAHSGVISGKEYERANLREYNHALLLATDLDQLELDAPHLLPIYLSLALHPDFPKAGEPVQRLKHCLQQHGITQKGWRFIFHSNLRLVTSMRDVYFGSNTYEETLDYLRIVCALGMKSQCPEPLLKTFFGAWGNQAQREWRYWHYLSRWNFYPHFLALAIQRYGSVPFDQLEEELLSIIRWARATKLKVTKEQKRLEWDWLLRKARAYEGASVALQSRGSVCWNVPTPSVTVDEYQVDFLSSAIDLWDEALQMRNCVEDYAKKCLNTNLRLASIKRDGRRVATAMFVWHDSVLQLVQIAGKANRPVDFHVINRLRLLQIESAKSAFKRLPENTQIVWKNELQLAECLK